VRLGARSREVRWRMWAMAGAPERSSTPFVVVLVALVGLLSTVGKDLRDAVGEFHRRNPRPYVPDAFSAFWPAAVAAASEPPQGKLMNRTP
jgi:hypothetical protein